MFRNSLSEVAAAHGQTHPYDGCANALQAQTPKEYGLTSAISDLKDAVFTSAELAGQLRSSLGISVPETCGKSVEPEPAPSSPISIITEMTQYLRRGNDDIRASVRHINS